MFATKGRSHPAHRQIPSRRRLSLPCKRRLAQNDNAPGFEEAVRVYEVRWRDG